MRECTSLEKITFSSLPKLDTIGYDFIRGYHHMSITVAVSVDCHEKVKQYVSGMSSTSCFSRTGYFCLELLFWFYGAN